MTKKQYVKHLIYDNKLTSFRTIFFKILSGNKCPFDFLFNFNSITLKKKISLITRKKTTNSLIRIISFHTLDLFFYTFKIVQNPYQP